MGDAPAVVAVVVSWNRRALLIEALHAVCGQTRAPESVVVVDNASQDGSALAVRREFPGVDLLALGQNVGGAGGFAAGIQRALAAHGPDLIWLLDDDTVPEPDALAALLAARTAYPGTSRPVLLASRVLWTDGRQHPMNTPRRRPFPRAADVRRAAVVGATPIRSASFVSIAVDADVVRRRGLPVADYFLWNDDFEYTTRLLRGGVGLLCPDSVVIHKTRSFGATDVDPGPDRFFLEVRNKVWLFTRSRGLGPLERAAYAGSSVRRWARTLATAKDRGALLRALVRGVRVGLRSGPRDTAQLLASVPVVSVPADG